MNDYEKHERKVVTLAKEWDELEKKEHDVRLKIITLESELSTIKRKLKEARKKTKFAILTKVV